MMTRVVKLLRDGDPNAVETAILTALVTSVVWLLVLILLGLGPRTSPISPVSPVSRSRLDVSDYKAAFKEEPEQGTELVADLVKVKFRETNGRLCEFTFHKLGVKCEAYLIADRTMVIDEEFENEPVVIVGILAGRYVIYTKKAWVAFQHEMRRNAESNKTTTDGKS